MVRTTSYHTNLKIHSAKLSDGFAARARPHQPFAAAVSSADSHAPWAPKTRAALNVVDDDGRLKTIGASVALQTMIRYIRSSE